MLSSPIIITARRLGHKCFGYFQLFLRQLFPSRIVMNLHFFSSSLLLFSFLPFSHLLLAPTHHEIVLLVITISFTMHQRHLFHTQLIRKNQVCSILVKFATLDFFPSRKIEQTNIALFSSNILISQYFKYCFLLRRTWTINIVFYS